MRSHLRRALGSAGMLQNFPSAELVASIDFDPWRVKPHAQCLCVQEHPSLVLPPSQPVMGYLSSFQGIPTLSAALAFPLAQLSLFWAPFSEPGVNICAHISLPGFSFKYPSSLVLPLECFGWMP